MVERTVSGSTVPDGVRPGDAAVVEEFAAHLSLQRGLSEHTVRAYSGDLLNLLGSAPGTAAGADLTRLDLAVLRRWLAGLAARGLSRSTLARRGAAARTFTRWATRRGLMPSDPGLRLRSPRADRTLPTVLTPTQAAAALGVVPPPMPTRRPTPIRPCERSCCATMPCSSSSTAPRSACPS
ncbi:site-specific integrase [Litorihabitans aurantiacus]|uniref:Core-binding (CB) domain-containing protein n=1 Tax=Litorihabitans aurantiacus TaxID=1930061 RepID=A0AA37XF11_9MICO|nr:hypothetical protein GCM10025875_17920 [Litorihabitans aurantiacus]